MLFLTEDKTMKKSNISNTKEGVCVNCGTLGLLDANNRHKRYVCEKCWYACNYDRVDEE